MKRSVLVAVAAVALLSGGAQGGEVKIHQWPCVFIPQEVAAIPVVMDVGLWVRIKDQDKLRIKLSQVSIHEFTGCTDIVVESNFNLCLSCAITPTGAVPGKWSCSVNPANVDAPRGTVTVCATVKEADLSKTPGGSKNIVVATVSIRVMPRA